MGIAVFGFDRINRVAGGNEKGSAIAPAKAKIGSAFRQQNTGEQFSLRAEDLGAVSGASPQAARLVATHAVGAALVEGGEYATFAKASVRFD